jgi:peptide/nickel transport system substrate-binding protein
MLAGALTGCSSEQGRGGGDAVDVLSVASVVEPTSYDPTRMDCVAAPLYCQAAYDTLTHLDPDGRPVPGMATSFRYDGSRTTLTLTLRAGITFTDGSAFDASVAQANIQHFREVRGPASAMAAAVTSVRAVGVDQLVIGLSAPDPSLLSNLATNLGMMVSARAIGKVRLATAPVGSGPYLLDAADTRPGTAVFRRNRDYWDRDSYPFSRVRFSVLTDPNTILNAFKAGQVNVGPVGEPQVKTIESLGGSVMRSTNGWLGLILADRDGRLLPAMGDLRVRQAINYALDRDLFGTVAVPGGRPATTTEQIFAPGSAAYAEDLDAAFPHDVSNARRLMAAAGHAAGFTVSMPDFSAVSGSPALNTYLEQQLAAIKIKVRWARIPPAELISSIQGGKYAMTFMLLGSRSSWQDIETAVLPEAPFNPFRSTDTGLARLVAAAQHADTETSARAAFRAVNRWLVEHAWFAPLTLRPSVEAAGPGVTIEQQAQGVDLARFKRASS